MTIPLYIAEISPAVHRGKLVAADELFIVLGIFLSFLVNWIVKVTEVSHPWRVSFGISIAFALIQLFGLYFLPESPRWLISQNRDEEAHNIFKRIRESKDEIDREIAEIHDALAQVDHHLTWVSALPLLVNSGNRKPLIISLTLAMFVQVLRRFLMILVFVHLKSHRCPFIVYWPAHSVILLRQSYRVDCCVWPF